MRLVSIWKRFKAKRHYYPASKSNVIAGSLVAAGVAASSIIGYTIISGTFSSAGAATESSSGKAVAVTTNSSAGVGTAAFTGGAILTSALSASGASPTAFVGANVFNGILSASGTATASFGYPNEQIVSTKMIQLPVDCVLAGQQDRFKKGRVSRAGVKHAFGE